jgi:hypothetical protein
MPELNAITIANPVLGGLSDSRYLGLKDSLYKVVGFDLHSEPGIMKVSQKFSKISGSLIDGLIKEAVVCSNGETYLFSADSGKIWRIKSDNATVELCYTTVAGAGESKCLGAEEYNGYVYWATQSRLHRILLTNALTTTWTTLDLNWATFTNGDLLYHPMAVQNDVLYIGDKSLVAQVDAGTFSASALDLPFPSQHRISAMEKYLTALLAGTFVASSVVQSIAVLWNTWSVSFSTQDDIPEAGVNCFIKGDNITLANCGKKGNLYIFNGQQFEQYKRIPGDWGGPFGPKQAIVYPDASCNANGLPFFGLSNVNGNPTEQGVYSYGSYSREYPKILSLEYPVSTGNLSNVEIGSVFMVGTDLFCTWKDGNDTPSYGVDKLDQSNKYAAPYFETREISVARDETKEFLVEVYYRSLPNGTGITLQAKINNGTWKTVSDIPGLALVPDASRNRLFTKIAVQAATVQFRISATASGNNAPEIESASILFP